MFSTLKTPFRALVAALALGFAFAPVAVAQMPPTTRSSVRESAYANEYRATNSGDAELGVMWIVLGILIVVFFVWLCAKIGDNHPADGQLD